MTSLWCPGNLTSRWSHERCRTQETAGERHGTQPVHAVRHRGAMPPGRRLKVTLTVLALALAAGLACVVPTPAITYGEPDGTAHPYVGILVFFDASGNLMWRCSGTLLAPRVFLTAGHCTSGVTSARIWFDADVSTVNPYVDGLTGTPIPHPEYDGSGFPDTHDVGVVLLDKDASVATYGALPPPGILDALATQRGRAYPTFTVVGYGYQAVKPRYQAELMRYQAASQLVNLRSALTDGYNLQTSNAPGIGGGTCFGDSGGPVLLGTSTLVVGVTSFGLNNNCKGVDFAYRTDIQDALDWIRSFLP